MDTVEKLGRSRSIGNKSQMSQSQPALPAQSPSRLSAFRSRAKGKERASLPDDGSTEGNSHPVKRKAPWLINAQEKCPPQGHKNSLCAVVRSRPRRLPCHANRARRHFGQATTTRPSLLRALPRCEASSTDCSGATNLLVMVQRSSSPLLTFRD